MEQQQCFKHDFDDPDPTDEFKTTIHGITYHEVIGDKCKNCEVVKLACFKSDNKTLSEPDVVYELSQEQIQDLMK